MRALDLVLPSLLSRVAAVPALLCVLALAACGDRSTGPDLPALIADLKSPDEKKSGAARLELISLGEVAAPALVTLLETGPPEDKILAATTIWGMGARAALAVPALSVTLSDPDPELRVTAAMALENMGPSAGDAVPALVKALQDPERPVRQAAVKALGAIGPVASPALPAIDRAIQRESWPEAEEAALRIRGGADAPTGEGP